MTNAEINESRRIRRYNENHKKKLIVSVCLPIESSKVYEDNYIHAEEAGGNIFISKELLELVKEFLKM